MKKLTIEFVRESFAKEGYTLLSEVYTNNSTKLDYICPKGHRHSIVWGNWKQKQRCPTCFGHSKPTIEHVKQSFEAEGYTLLSTEYKNNNTKLDFICSNGHKHSITWGKWGMGTRCFYCVGKITLTIDFIKEELAKENYTLLTNVYIRVKSHLKYMCPSGHEHYLLWCNWKKGHRCPTCANIKNSGPGHHSWVEDRTGMKYCEIWRDEDYKAGIRERDDHKCLNPYCSSKNPGKLNIHHVNYDKKDCHFKNLITVCHECNLKANYDREWHQDWYQALLHNRYGYNY